MAVEEHFWMFWVVIDLRTACFGRTNENCILLKNMRLHSQSSMKVTRVWYRFVCSWGAFDLGECHWSHSRKATFERLGLIVLEQSAWLSSAKTYRKRDIAFFWRFTVTSFHGHLVPWSPRSKSLRSIRWSLRSIKESLRSTKESLRFKGKLSY